jgi:hypothetical protein
MSEKWKTSHAFSFLLSTDAKFINTFQKMPSYFTTHHKISLHLNNISTINYHKGVMYRVIYNQCLLNMNT